MVGVVGNSRTSTPARRASACRRSASQPWRREDARGRPGGRRLEDRAHRRVRSRRAARPAGADRGHQPLGHQRAFVEQRGRPRNGVEVDSTRVRPAPSARRRPRRKAPRPARRRRSRAPRPGRRAEARRPAPGRDGCCRRPGARRGPARRSRAATSAARGGVVDGQREDRHAVERRQAGTTPVVDSSPRLGFRPTMLLNAAGTRPEPAVSVPSAKLTRPARHRDRRARAGAAGDVARVERIARHAVGRADADQAGRELVQVGLADADRAGGEQPLHHRGDAPRRVGEGGAGGGGRAARRRRCCP